MKEARHASREPGRDIRGKKELGEARTTPEAAKCGVQSQKQELGKHGWQHKGRYMGQGRLINWPERKCHSL